MPVSGESRGCALRRLGVITTAVECLAAAVALNRLPQKQIDVLGFTLATCNNRVFEKGASMAVKKSNCLLDFAGYRGAERFCGDVGRTPAAGTCLGEMMAGRGPPISPAVFGASMRARVATGELKFPSTLPPPGAVAGLARPGFHKPETPGRKHRSKSAADLALPRKPLAEDSALKQMFRQRIPPQIDDLVLKRNKILDAAPVLSRYVVDPDDAF